MHFLLFRHEQGLEYIYKILLLLDGTNLEFGMISLSFSYSSPQADGK